MCPTPCHVICLLIPILRSWKQDINKKKLKGLKVNGKTRKPRFLKNHPLAVTLPSQSQFGHSKLTRKSHDKLTTWSRHHFPNPRILIVAKCTGYASKLRGRGHPVNSWKHLLSVYLVVTIRSCDLSLLTSSPKKPPLTANNISFEHIYIYIYI